MPPATIPAARFEGLARRMDLLSSPVRLAILHALRTPRTVSDIRVEGVEGDGRPLARQSVSWHLDQLVDAGLVRRLRTEDRSTLYVLDHKVLFAMVDGMRQLSRLRPIVGVLESQGSTHAELALEEANLPDGPRLLVAYGRDEGVAFALDGAGPWTVGRDGDAHAVLDYDPFASAEHACIHATEDGFMVEDLGSRNGTLVNGTRLAHGNAVPLAPGDVLTVGRCQLVFQP